MYLTITPGTINTKGFLSIAMLLLSFVLISVSAPAQSNPRLQLLNAAVHDTTFLKKAPEIQYPIVFIYEQEQFYQQSADAQVEPQAAEAAQASHTVVKISRLALDDAKQEAKLKMMWNQKIIKLSLEDYQPLAHQAKLKGLKIRDKNKFWPSYMYLDFNVDTDDKR